MSTIVFRSKQQKNYTRNEVHDGTQYKTKINISFLNFFTFYQWFLTKWIHIIVIMNQSILIFNLYFGLDWVYHCSHVNLSSLIIKSRCVVFYWNVTKVCNHYLLHIKITKCNHHVEWYNFIFRIRPRRRPKVYVRKITYQHFTLM